MNILYYNNKLNPKLIKKIIKKKCLKNKIAKQYYSRLDIDSIIYSNNKKDNIELITLSNTYMEYVLNLLKK